MSWSGKTRGARPAAWPWARFEEVGTLAVFDFSYNPKILAQPLYNTWYFVKSDARDSFWLAGLVI